MVHAVKTTKREIVHAYEMVRRAASETVNDHITYQEHRPSRVSRCYQCNECTIDKAPRSFGKVNNILRPVIMNANAV